MKKGAVDELLGCLTLPSLEDLTIIGNAQCTLDRLDDFITRSGCEHLLKRFKMRDTPASDSDELPILELLKRLTNLSVLDLQTSTRGLEPLLSILKENSSFLNLRSLCINWQPALDEPSSPASDSSLNKPSRHVSDAEFSESDNADDREFETDSYPQVEAEIRDFIHARTKPQQWQSPEGKRMSVDTLPAPRRTSLYSLDPDSPCRPLELFQVRFLRSGTRKFLEAMIHRLDRWQGRERPDEEQVRKKIDKILREIEDTIQSKTQPDGRLTEEVSRMLPFPIPYC